MRVFKNIKPKVLCIIACIVFSVCASALTYGRLLSAGLSFPQSCTEEFLTADKGLVSTAGLSPESISLFDWNIYKGSRKGWDDDFLRLSDGKDIILLQEASLDERLQELLQRRNLYWDLNNAFFNKGQRTGVLSASTRQPMASCGQRTSEPLIGVPKTVLIARYAIEGSKEELLVANIHGINITLGTGSYQQQFDQLGDILKNHKGPLLVAGDFNNWSDGRSTIVAELAERLSLQKINFGGERRTTFFGDPVDQIYYRGLQPLQSAVHLVKSSDHNPISATFRLARIEAESTPLKSNAL